MASHGYGVTVPTLRHFAFWQVLWVSPLRPSIFRSMSKTMPKHEALLLQLSLIASLFLRNGCPSNVLEYHVANHHRGFTSRQQGL
jgi:hypothetical protein